jgi:predicted methyltransferase
MRGTISKLVAVVALATAVTACSAADDDSAEEISAPQGEIGDPVPVPQYVTDAVADPRRDRHRDRDAYRHPAEVIAFSGLAPGDTVLDLIPSSGYWSRIFSPLVGANGHVYAIWPKNYADVAQNDVKVMRELAARDDYANLTVDVQPTPDLSAPEPLDMVFTSQNYHDYPDEFMGHYDPDKLNRAVFAMLKPGGTYFIVDHAAQSGSGMRDTDTLHRIDPAIVRAQVEAAGFEFVGESGVLRNLADDHTLPVFDPRVRRNTDQFILRFRKPG